MSELIFVSKQNRASALLSKKRIVGKAKNASSLELSVDLLQHDIFSVQRQYRNIRSINLAVTVHHPSLLYTIFLLFRIS